MDSQIWYLTHPPDPEHYIFHDQYMHAAWEVLFLSDYYAPSQTHNIKVVPSP
jgi:hypothetical protein